MQITFHPTRCDTPLTLARAGDVLTVNGTAYDLGPVTEGSALPAEATGCDWFVGQITRAGGVLALSLALPHGAATPEAARTPWTETLSGDGALTPTHPGTGGQ